MTKNDTTNLYDAHEIKEETLQLFQSKVQSSLGATGARRKYVEPSPGDSIETKGDEGKERKLLETGFDQ